MLPRIVRAIRSIADNNAGRKGHNILHRNRAHRKVAGPNTVPVVPSSRPAVIVRVATNIGPAPALKATSGVSVRVKGEFF
jgi:hypothetical protein